MPTRSDDVVESMLAAWRAGRADRVLAVAAAAPAAAIDDDRALAVLGLAQQRAGMPAQAMATFTRLTRMRPTVSAWWNNLGVASREAGDPAASEDAFSRARALAPRDPDVRYNLGLLYVQQRRWPAARQALLDAVSLSPGFIAARLQAAYACHACGDSDGEADTLEAADGWPPQAAADALKLAAMLSSQGRPDAALETLARATFPDDAAAATWRLRLAAQRVFVYERANRLADARRDLAMLPVDRIEALPGGALEARAAGWRAHAVVAMRDGRVAEAAGFYQRALDAAIDPENRAAAAFGLAAAQDRRGRYRDAWQALTTAHAAQAEAVRQTEPERLEPERMPLPMAARTVDARSHAAWRPLETPPAAASPVFVIGFPRSGTTLLEQMLDAHPDFASMGERGFIHDLIERMARVGQPYPAGLATLSQADADQLRAVYWRRVAQALPDLGARRLVDKNPLNMLCLPMIVRLFPRAPIILCLRHPCDVVLSCSMQAFRSPAFMAMGASLPRLARGYADAFTQCCAHLEVFDLPVLEWRYERVVDDFAGAIATLGRFLRVRDASPFAGFAAHARGRAHIGTPSYAQVTESISRAAVGRWHHYREHFEPVLPRLQAWIARFGYRT